ncbi:polysaccharide pyruvyl transferase family protein [Kaistia granuli]|uniref:polysaccharide pyruvyl transferase family protein n=1 Tax=Kaistia granuli TaxID=363259 RepID=UPI000366BBBF|nr:polysaccharide pyruvyl transferase family protein [Kaistia granuli]
MKIALLDYSNTVNIGDNIQTLAVAQHVDQAYDLVDRDFLHAYSGEPVVVVMNGWFTHEPQNWPPSPAITPIFFGFHMTPDAAEAYRHSRDYFARFAPIGCRDKATAEILKSWDVDAYVSGCATMTFPTRSEEPRQPKLVLVDQPFKHFLSGERRGHVSISHEVPSYMSRATKFQVAKDMLEFYRDHAGMVVTSRIHCAMPCAAMGIPTVYTGIQEGRTKVIDMIGIPSAQTKRFPRTRLAELSVKAPNFEDVKARVIADLQARLGAHGIRTRRAVT